jgi:hypothetical protein
MTKTDQIRDKRELLTKEAAAQIQELVKDKKGYLDFNSNGFMEGDGDTIHGFNCSSMFAIGFSSEYSLGEFNLNDTILLLECIEEAISIEQKEEPQNYYSIQTESGNTVGVIREGEDMKERLRMVLVECTNPNSVLSLKMTAEYGSIMTFIFEYTQLGDHYSYIYLLTPVTIY